MARKTLEQLARHDPLLAQSLVETHLQIDPQVAALRELLAGKRSDLQQTRALNASSARGITSAATQAGQQIGQIYGGDPSSPAQGSLLAALAGSRGTPEGQAAYTRLAAEGASGQAGMQNTAVRAQAGKVYGNQQARSEFLSAKDQIERSGLDLARQQGLLTSSTYDKLLEAQRQRALTRRGQDITAKNGAAGRTQQERDSMRTAGLNPDTGLPIPNGPLDPNSPRYKPKGGGGTRAPGGGKLATPEQHDNRSTYIGQILNEAKPAIAAAKKKGLTGKAARRYVVQTLTTEQPATKYWTDAKGNMRTAPPSSQNRDQWTEHDVPGSKALPPDVWMTAALDSIFNGGLSLNTQKHLQRHFSVRDLGFGPGGQYGLTAGERRKLLAQGRNPGMQNPGPNWLRSAAKALNG